MYILVLFPGGGEGSGATGIAIGVQVANLTTKTLEKEVKYVQIQQ